MPPEIVLSPLLLALIPMLAIFCKSDGVVSKPEIDLVNSFFTSVLNLNQEHRRSAILLFQKSKDSQLSFAHYLNQLALARPDPAILHMIVDLLMAIAISDGEISTAEESLLSNLIEQLNLADSSYHQYQRRKQQRHKSPSPRQTSQRSEYLATLGLSEGCSPQQLKQAYRTLVTQYHPDKVQHLGPKLREVAEQEMKRINEAYNFLC